jgi:hypothetical protein
MPNIAAIDLAPLSLWTPILTRRARLAAIEAGHVAVRWALATVSAVLAAISVAGIAIGFAAVDGSETGFFDLATRSLTLLAQLVG